MSTTTYIQPANNLMKHSNSMNKLSSNSTVIDDPFIVHPGAISSILHLLPTVPLENDDHVRKI
jgi:hypothetical protein